MLGKAVAQLGAWCFLLAIPAIGSAAEPKRDYVEARREAVKLAATDDPKIAVQRFEGLSYAAATAFQQSDALDLTAQAAQRTKDFSAAMQFAKAIPLPSYSKLAQMRVLIAMQRSAELVKQFGNDDLLNYPDMILGEAAFFRGSAWFVVKDGARAEQDLLLAAAYATDDNLRGESLLHLGATYRQFFNDDAKAIAAYRRVYETKNEFKQSSAAIAVSTLLLAQGKVAEARAELERIDERKLTIPVYRDAWLKAKQAVDAAAATKPNPKAEKDR